MRRGDYVTAIKSYGAALRRLRNGGEEGEAPRA